MADASPLDQIYARFERPADLLAALASSSSEDFLFPSKVWCCDGNGAVAIQLPSSWQTVVAQASEMCGWNASFPDQVNGTGQIPLRDLVVNAEYEYVDIGTQAVECPETGAMEYWLEAEDRAQAAALLELLLAVRTPEIHVRPIVATPTSGNRKAPFLFWRVRGRQPPRSALNSAHRAWWGPVARTVQRNTVLVQWPLKLQVPTRVLEHTDWGTEGGLVLVGPDAPQCFRVIIRENQPRIEDLILVADVKATRCEPHVLEAGDPNGLRFPIQLRLVPPTRPVRPSERIRQLELEIEAKRKARDRLTDEMTDEDELIPPVFEPLYIYQSEPGVVPQPIQDLLIECCDQQELRNLRYLRMDADSLPGSSTTDPHDLHVLTTASAFAEPSTDGRHLWLKEYAPGGYGAYRLLPEWARFGLRLFIPDDERRLALYPNAKPGPQATRMLAEGLLPQGTGDYREYCAALLPLPDGSLVSCHMWQADFQPLLDSFAWRCSVEVSAAAVDRRVGDSQAAEDWLIETSRAAFKAAVPAAEKALLEEEIQKLEKAMKGHLDQLATDEEAADKKLGELRDRLTRENEALDKADELISRIHKAGSDLVTQCDSLRALLSRGVDHFTNVRNIANVVIQTEHDVATLMHQLQELRKK